MEPRVLAHDSAGEGAPVLLIPGRLTGWLSWIPHQERMRDRYQAIRIQPIANDEGDAGRPREPGYTVLTEIESLALTLDELGFADAHLVGWSSGAELLMDFSFVYPERARSLTLVEPSAYWILTGRGEGDAHQAEVSGFLDTLAGKDITDDDLAAFLSYLGLAESPAAIREHPNWPNWLPHKMALSWRSVGDDSVPRSIDGLSKAACPVLLVQGTTTAEWRKRVLEIVDEQLLDSKVVEIEGGHSAFAQSIDEFLGLLEAHLQ